MTRAFTVSGLVIAVILLAVLLGCRPDADLVRNSFVVVTVGDRQEQMLRVGDGWVITPYHVLRGDTVQLPGRVVRRDYDLAAFFVGTGKGLPLWPTARLQLGHEVMTMGFPNIGGNMRKHVVRRGVVASLSPGKLNDWEDESAFFVVNVQTSPGDSGAAVVVSREGRTWLVGILVSSYAFPLQVLPFYPPQRWELGLSGVVRSEAIAELTGLPLGPMQISTNKITD